jgi:hypothetical protein
VNAYEVSLHAGGSEEVEAEFFERDGEDWVFYAGGEEMKRVPMATVQAVTKIPTRDRPPEEPPEQLFI